MSCEGARQGPVHRYSPECSDAKHKALRRQPKCQLHNYLGHTLIHAHPCVAIPTEGVGKHRSLRRLPIFAIWTMANEGSETPRVLFSRSLMINPNSALALALGGWIETMGGNQSGA